MSTESGNVSKMDELLKKPLQMMSDAEVLELLMEVSEEMKLRNGRVLADQKIELAQPMDLVVTPQGLKP